MDVYEQLVVSATCPSMTPSFCSHYFSRPLKILLSFQGPANSNFIVPGPSCNDVFLPLTSILNLCYSLYLILPCVLIFLKTLFFKRSFWFIAKLRESYRNFPYIPASTDE